MPRTEIDQNIKNFLRTLPSEEIYFEAIRDIMKDLIKEYIREKISQDKELKAEIVQVLKDFISAKIKEYDSLAKMARVTAKIGVKIAPESLREEAIGDFMDVFQKELEEIIKRTM